MGYDEAKLDNIYSFRIPKVTKDMVDKLNRTQKADLNRRLLLEIAKKIHEANFNPEIYLGHKKLK